MPAREINGVAENPEGVVFFVQSNATEGEESVAIFGEAKGEDTTVGVKGQGKDGVKGVGTGPGGHGVFGVAHAPDAIGVCGYKFKGAAAGYFIGKVRIAAGDLIVDGGNVRIAAGDLIVEGNQHIGLLPVRGKKFYCLASPANWFEYIGSATIEKEGGTQVIEFDEKLVHIEDDQYHVFLTPYGVSNGLYVAKDEKNPHNPASFTVHERPGAGRPADKQRLDFGYRIVAKRKDV